MVFRTKFTNTLTNALIKASEKKYTRNPKWGGEWGGDEFSWGGVRPPVATPVLRTRSTTLLIMFLLIMFMEEFEQTTADFKL